MSKEQTSITPKAVSSDSSKHGFVPGVAHLALDVADKGQATAIALLHDARVEIRGAVDGGIELAEKLAQSGVRFARKLTQRVDEASAELLAGVERVLGGAVKSARETTRAAQDLATTATSGVTGHAQA